MRSTSTASSGVAGDPAVLRANCDRLTDRRESRDSCDGIRKAWPAARPRRNRDDERRRRCRARAAGRRPHSSAPGLQTRITWVLQPGPASLVRGHGRSTKSSSSIASAGGGHLRDVRRALAAPAVRRRARPPGVSQGGHRDRVHARARQARIRSRPGARRELAVHHASNPAASRRPTRAGSVLRVSRRARRAARRAGVGSRSLARRARGAAAF